MECEGLNNVISRKERLLQGESNSKFSLEAPLITRCAGESKNSRVRATAPTVNSQDFRKVDAKADPDNDDAAGGRAGHIKESRNRMLEYEGGYAQLERTVGEGCQGFER